MQFRNKEKLLADLHDLAINIPQPFETMTKEDLQDYIANKKLRDTDGTVMLRQVHIKRFFRWIKWVEVNENKRDEEQVDIKSVEPPYCVRWIKQRYVESDIEFEDLPTEEEVLRIASCVNSQRDRALILSLWETGSSPIEILSLRVKDLTFNQYGAVVKFRRYKRKRTEVNKLKTPYRYRSVPVATSVPDLQLWLSMHPQKDDPEAPLWLSRKGGALSYVELYSKFKNAVKKARIKKHLTPYSFRHKRLTQVGEILGIHELKKFAGHSRYSPITQRYLHADEKRIQQKVWKERGVEVKEKEITETALTIKVCPRCKQQNSPTFKFCAMCSMPLDMETIFEVQKKGELMLKGVYRAIDDEEYNKLMKAFAVLQQNNPNLFKELNKRFWEMVAVELMKPRIKT